MDIEHSAEYKDHWATFEQRKAPWALRAALLSLAGGRSVTASYLNYSFSPHGNTDWFGVWLLGDVLITATARASSYGDVPWDFRQEADHPRDEQPVVHANLFRIRDLTKFSITEQQAKIGQKHIHIISKYRLQFGESAISLPPVTSSEINDAHEQLAVAVHSAWVR